MRYVDVESSFDSSLESAGDVTDKDICDNILGNSDFSEEELEGKVNEPPVALSAAFNTHSISDSSIFYQMEQFIMSQAATSNQRNITEYAKTTDLFMY